MTESLLRDQFRELYTVELREALDHPALARIDQEPPYPEEACQAAYELARTLGRCHTLGLDAGDELDGDLPPAIALAAAECLHGRLREGIAECLLLVEHWENAADQSEADACCIELLEARFDASAAMEAINSARLNADEDADTLAPLLAAHIDEILTLLRHFDEELERQADTLSTLSGTNYLDNCRTLWNANPEADPLPWWLDGRLEARGAEVDRQVAAGLGRSLERPTGTLTYPTTASFRRIEVPRLAAGIGSDSFPRTVTYTWDAPFAKGKARKAILVVPELPEAGDETPLKLLFVDFCGAPVQDELEGQAVRLATCQSTIGHDGTANFRYGELRQASSDLILFVGPSQVQWPLSQESFPHP